MVGSNTGERSSSSSRTLHNFSLPPRLNWGSQRLLRCAASNNNHRHHNNHRENHPSHDQILAIRDKLMLDLTSQVDKFRSTCLQQQQQPQPPPPWNLRTRRSPSTVDVSPSPAPLVEVVTTGGGGGSGGERAKFSVALSKQEIEDDFVRIVGRRPPRKPKKRPRYIQKHLDTLFPGLWLSEITPDMYSVNENPDKS